MYVMYFFGRLLCGVDYIELSSTRISIYLDHSKSPGSLRGDKSASPPLQRTEQSDGDYANACDKMAAISGIEYTVYIHYERHGRAQETNFLMVWFTC
jgi:hypothetical protein